MSDDEVRRHRPAGLLPKAQAGQVGGDEAAAAFAVLPEECGGR